MRAFLLLLPAVLLAQTPPSTGAKSTSAAKSTAVKSATAAKSTAAAKSSTAAKSTAAPAAGGAGMTDDQKTIYALGLDIARSISGFNLSPAELELVKKALTDAAAGKPQIDLDTYRPKLGTLFDTRMKAASAAFLAKAAAQPGATRTPSGLVYKEERAGSGASPKATDKVRVNYRGTLTNGTEFDSSYKSGKPFETPLTNVIPCWTEGVQKMKVGGKAMLTCPANLAYGDRGSPPQIPGGSTLVFEVELLDILPPGAGK